MSDQAPTRAPAPTLKWPSFQPARGYGGLTVGRGGIEPPTLGLESAHLQGF